MDVDAKYTGAPQNFPNLRSAIDFILKCVNDNDAETLTRACKIQPKELFIPLIFKSLNEIKTKIIEEYLDKDFPADSEKFSIGGCGLEWRFMHIDFEKIEEEWYLREIWICR